MAVDAGTFPRPRTQRAGPAPSAQAITQPGAGAAPPQSHVIPFAIQAAVNSRSATSAGPFRGPALVTGIHFSKGGPANNTVGIVLGKHTSVVSETNLAAGAARAWRPLFDPRLENGIAAPNAGPTDTSVDEQPSLLSNDANLGIVILEAEFHLVVAVYTGATASFGMFGHVNLLEQVSPEALRNFL